MHDGCTECVIILVYSLALFALHVLHATMFCYEYESRVYINFGVIQSLCSLLYCKPDLYCESKKQA